MAKVGELTVYVDMDMQSDMVELIDVLLSIHDNLVDDDTGQRYMLLDLREKILKRMRSTVAM